MVSKILNPLTGRMINSHSITAKMIIHNYQTGGAGFNRMITMARNAREKAGNTLAGRAIQSVKNFKVAQAARNARRKMAAFNMRELKIGKKIRNSPAGKRLSQGYKSFKEKTSNSRLGKKISQLKQSERYQALKNSANNAKSKLKDSAKRYSKGARETISKLKESPLYKSNEKRLKKLGRKLRRKSSAGIKSLKERSEKFSKGARETISKLKESRRYKSLREGAVKLRRKSSAGIKSLRDGSVRLSEKGSARIKLLKKRSERFSKGARETISKLKESRRYKSLREGAVKLRRKSSAGIKSLRDGSVRLSEKGSARIKLLKKRSERFSKGARETISKLKESPQYKKAEKMAQSVRRNVDAFQKSSRSKIQQANRIAQQKLRKIKESNEFQKMKKGLEYATHAANKLGENAQRLVRSASNTDMRTLSQQAMLQGRQIADSSRTKETRMVRSASASDLKPTGRQERGLARAASASNFKPTRSSASTVKDSSKSRGARGTFSKLNDMQRRAGVKMAKGITKGISNKYNAANRAQRKFAKETGDKVKNNPGLLKAKDTVKKVTKPVGRALSPITKPTGAAIKFVGKTGKQGVMGVARTGKGTVGRSMKIMKNLGTSYKDSFKSTTNVTRNLAQSARSATRQSAVGNAAREFSRVVKQREAKVKRGSLAGQSTKGLYRQPSQYGKLLKIKTARNIKRFAETPGALAKSLHAVNREMYGDTISSVSNSLGSINKRTIDVLKSPKKLFRKRNSDKTETRSLRLNRSKHRQQINQDSMIKKERETKSQGEIALSSAVDTVKEGIKSFNEHRKLLRKGSIKNTRRKVSSQDNSNNKIKSTIQSMLHLINSSDDKDALKSAMLTLAGVSNQSSVDGNLLSKLKQLIGEKNIQILKNLKKIP